MTKNEILWQLTVLYNTNHLVLATDTQNRQLALERNQEILLMILDKCNVRVTSHQKEKSKDA
jgi:hypothetical protein